MLHEWLTFSFPLIQNNPLVQLPLLLLEATPELGEGVGIAKIITQSPLTMTVN
jgi:hypothetical protein